MSIKLSYYGQARAIAGVEHEEVDVPTPASVRQVVDAVVGRHPDLKTLMLTDEGEMRRSILLPVNDEVVDLTAADTVQENDDVSIYPPVSGG